MPKTNYGKPQAPQKHRDWLDHFSNVIFVLTFFSALAAAIFTGYQASVSREQLTIIRDTEKRQLRGYLGITEMRFDCKECVPDAANNIEIKSENYGTTPLVVMTAILWMTQFGINEPFPLQEWSSQFYVSAAEEMPHYPRNPRAIEFPITAQFKEMIAKAYAGEAWLAIRGLVSYQDVFNDFWGNSFCFIYNPKN
jgi:hypothetical protein